MKQLQLTGIAITSAVLIPAAAAALTSVGDIAFTAYSPTAENFAFAALTDIDAGQAIFFDDQEWTGTAFANTTSEGNARWTNNTGSTISAGTIITITDASNNAGGTANIGLVEEINGGFNLATTDGVFAYLGTDRSPTVFLAGIGDADSTSGLTSLTGTGLTLGLSALDTNASGTIEYTGPRSGEGSFADYLPLINNLANWSAAPSVDAGTFNSTSIDSVPEPSSTILIGIGALSLTLRRSRR